MNKIIFEGDIGHANCVGHSMDMTFYYVRQDVREELHRKVGKYVRVTIEEIKQTEKKTNEPH